MTWLWLSAAMMIVTAIIHSVAGEKIIVGPVLAIDDPLTRQPRRRSVIRGAWHLTSSFMLMTAATVAWPGAPGGLVTLIGALWLFYGLLVLVRSKGRHPGWPSLSAAGVFALVGAWG